MKPLAWAEPALRRLAASPLAPGLPLPSPDASGAYRTRWCGEMGCVWPTSDARLALKVTRDQTEIAFAVRAIPEGAAGAAGVVRYARALALPGRRKEPLAALWREAVEAFGPDALALAGVNPWSRSPSLAEMLRACSHFANRLDGVAERMGDPAGLLDVARREGVRWKPDLPPVAELCAMSAGAPYPAAVGVAPPERRLGFYAAAYARVGAETGPAYGLRGLARGLLWWLGRGVAFADMKTDNLAAVRRGRRLVIVVGDAGQGAFIDPSVRGLRPTERA